jgi:hypothetical protein
MMIHHRLRVRRCFVHLRLTTLAFVILMPASAAVPPVHNLLTDATPESAAAAAMRAYSDPATAELATAMRQFPMPILEPDYGKIEVRNLADGVKGVLLHEAMVVASLGKHGSCPESTKALVTQRHDSLKGNVNSAGAKRGR